MLCNSCLEDDGSLTPVAIGQQPSALDAITRPPAEIANPGPALMVYPTRFGKARPSMVYPTRFGKARPSMVYPIRFGKASTFSAKSGDVQKKQRTAAALFRKFTRSDPRGLRTVLDEDDRSRPAATG